MPLHTVTVYLPGLRQAFNDLELKCGKHMKLVLDPHITIVNPFYPEVPTPLIKQKLQEVAKETIQFTLTYRGISSFEDSEGVLYYIAVENEQPVTDLHYALYASLSGLIDDHYKGRFNLSNFTPHVSIGGIPKAVMPEIEKALAGYNVRFEAVLDHYSFCAEDKNGTWNTLNNFALSG